MPGTYRCPAETGFYYLLSRYYDPVTRRFISADGQLNIDSLLGFNMFAYCENNPVIYSDPCGTCRHRWDFWHDCDNCGGATIKDKMKPVDTFIANTFGCGIVSTQEYEPIRTDTIFFGQETGLSTSKVVSGDISKPFSVFCEMPSNPWRFWEYKAGFIINTKKGSFSFSTNTLEANYTIATENSSSQLIMGINKIGHTITYDETYNNKKVTCYQHTYIRPIPATVAVAGMVFAGKYLGVGAAGTYLGGILLGT